MRQIFVIFLTLFCIKTFAQEAEIKHIPVDNDQPTDIQITKGDSLQRNYELHHGSSEITGDPVLLAQDARQSWKKACTDWKSEIKSMNNNSDDHVIAINCNSPTCSKTENATTTCKSTGTYTVKSKIR